VEPGFAGQKFITGSGVKIRRAKKLLEERAPHARWLQVDGGIGPDTIPEVVTAGANVLVAGSSLFKEPPSITAPRLRKAIAESLRKTAIENVKEGPNLG
jgi:ribulose-phosphate 3-epimerase